MQSCCHVVIGVFIGVVGADHRVRCRVGPSNGHVYTLMNLVERGKVDINAKDRFGQTPLHLACIGELMLCTIRHLGHAGFPWSAWP